MSDVFYGELEKEVKRLRTLADALEGFQSGVFPRSPTVTLDDWHVTVRPVTCLAGRVSGHPHIPDGKSIMTSQVYVFSEELALSRTLSRWYKLGLRVATAYQDRA